jgi:hypothetical protein
MVLQAECKPRVNGTQKNKMLNAAIAKSELDNVGTIGMNHGFFADATDIHGFLSVIIRSIRENPWFSCPNLHVVRFRSSFVYLP